MNLREWARITHRALREQAPEECSDLSLDQVEQVLRMSVVTLADALANDEDLCIAQLGRIWAEVRPPREFTGNLGREPKVYKITARKTVRLKPSAWLVNKLNPPHAK